MKAAVRESRKASHRTVYAIWRDRGSDYVFVAHPHLRGLYLRTHPCVLEVVCPSCSSVEGYPCLGVDREPKSCTHHTRRKKFAALTKAREK